MSLLAILMNSLRLKHKRRLANATQGKALRGDCCRTCLGSGDLRPIFPDSDRDSKRAAELLLLTGLQVQSDDGLPQHLCKTCESIVTEAMKFRRMSQKVYKTLYSTVAKAKRKAGPKLRLKNEDILFEDTPDYTDFAKVENAAEAEIIIDCTQTNIQNDNVAVVEVEFSNNFDTHEDYSYEYNAESQAKKPKGKKKKEKEPTQYSCSVCQKQFSMKNTYRAHMRFHNNYCVCELCGKKCRNNNLLLLHKRGVHGAERVHRCSYCEYAAANREGLVIHERRHTGEKPYICDHCGASFHRRSNLVQHIAIHLPDKKFQCPFCPKRLQSRKLLQIHVHGAHTGPRYAYLCPLCARRFNKPNKVRAHMRTAHAVNEPTANIERLDLAKGGY